MSFSLIPDYSFNKLTDITGDFLKNAGVKLLLLDLDNTISPYGEKEPSEEAIAWFEAMKKDGVTLFIVSNTKKPRAGIFAGLLGVDYIIRAKKPFGDGVERALGVTGFGESETALVGDQIFTDTLAANRANVTSLLVEPIKLNYPWLTLRYWVEKPFRMMAKNDLRRQ
jgi:HAD superfamily phosphatase (TIGR01668 family)